ncbi:AAA family ATPase [Bradyrhizobium sp. CB1650]|uniref:AAA family ATPase n=1 Tax=Bradyrhizobium sp. CB1650 TaxID=3039153 RepID=UPI002434B2B2|nr:AAA family ATPase [Bradyrhizobium sp. CB1650]WGD53188.1 AAA family ATPase [Bradyrhizobium sp. CB1650]
MLINALSVEGIGRFAGVARVDGFGAGVNVLAAGNEVGKSTLFKAIRACLFLRHDSKTQELRDLGSDDSQLPATVELDFDHEGRRYVIRKSFLRSPFAVLTEDGREIARAGEADKAIWDILGMAPGSGRSIDDGAFGLLWVGQGASFSAPVPGSGASSLLNSAIESEVGALVGGERARLAIDEITGEIRRNMTDSERGPRSDGPLARARERLEHWRKAEADGLAKVGALEKQFAELAQHRRRHREVTDPVAAAHMTEGLTDARNKLREAQAAHQEIRSLEAETSAARRALEGAAQRLRQLREIAERVDRNRSLEADLNGSLPGILAQEEEARASLARTVEASAATEGEAKELTVREQHLGRLAAAVLRASRKDELIRRLDVLERAAGSLRAIDAQLSQFRVDPETAARLDDLDRQLASLDAQLSAAAATLAIEVGPAGAGQVRAGSLGVDGNHVTAVLAPTKITIGDIATITVTPALHPRHEARKRLDADRSALLAASGVDDAAEAHAILTRRRDLDHDRRGVLAELKSLEASDDPTRAGAAVRSELAEVQAAIDVVLAATARAALPGQAEIDSERLGHEQRRASLEARREKLAAARQEHQRAVEAAVVRRADVSTRLEFVRKSIAEDLVLCPDADRAARDAALVAEVAACETMLQTKAATLAAVRQAAPDAAEIDRRELRCSRLEKALENHNAELMSLERDIGRLTGQIQAAGGDGIGEAYAAAQEQRKIAQRECARIEERIATLQLLRDTVGDCLAEGRERYYEPVRRHLRPYLNDLFPGAELELGDGFAITGMKRTRSESFRRLSGGTQEQIAVLVRLAMGTLLAERGGNVPVVLDDALVYCDDERINMMFDALSRAGRHQQVIVLTCRSHSFAPLGGNKLRVQMDDEFH